MWHRVCAVPDVSRLDHPFLFTVILNLCRYSGGMIAPILGGSLLMIDHSFPVYASIAIFIVAGVCVLLLEEREGERGGARTLGH